MLRLLLGCTLIGCAARHVPDRLERRDVRLSHSVRFFNLPDGSRIVEETGTVPQQRTVLATRLSGEITLSFPYDAREHVTNGVAGRMPRANKRILAIQAPGYMPRRFEISIPNTAAVDATLDRPKLTSVRVSPAIVDDVDQGLERVLSGRCKDAGVALGRARLAAATPREGARIDALIDLCTPLATIPGVAVTWSPHVLGIPSELADSPAAAIAAIRTLMAQENDAVGVLALERLVAAAAGGQLVESAQLAELIAKPLPPPRAALVLQLPTAVLAYERARMAAGMLKHGNAKTAFELAAEARNIDGNVAAGIFVQARDARINQLLRDGENARLAGNVLHAYSSFLAADALSQTTRTRAALESIARPLADAVKARVAVVAAENAHASRFLHMLASRVPRHVEVTTRTNDANGVAYVWISEPRREHTVRRAQRSKTVIIGTVKRPNPDYETARMNVNAARDRVASAEENAERMNAQAKSQIRQAQGIGGGYGAAIGAIAVAGDTAGRVMLKEARDDLDDAEAELARTPRELSEVVRETAVYPVLEITTTAFTKLEFQLRGFGAPLADTASATARHTTEQVIGSSEIDVADTAPNLDAARGLTPDVTAALSEVASKFAARIKEREVDGTWAAFVEARQQGRTSAAIALAAAYLAIDADAGLRRGQILEFLVEEIP